jgi:hypothetical protein
VIYEKVAFRPVRPLFKPLYSWDPDWDYRFTDVFPQMSNDGWIVYTDKQTGNSSIVVMRPDGSEKRKVFEISGARPRRHQGAHGPGRRLPAGLVAGRGMDRLRPRLLVRRAQHRLGGPVARAPRRHGAEQLTDGSNPLGLPELFGRRQGDRLPGLER